jgi:hypothetical protein
LQSLFANLISAGKRRHTESDELSAFSQTYPHLR